MNAKGWVGGWGVVWWVVGCGGGGNGKVQAKSCDFMGSNRYVMFTAASHISLNGLNWWKWTKNKCWWFRKHDFLHLNDLEMALKHEILCESYSFYQPLSSVK